MEHLTKKDEVIEALGGTKGLQDLLGTNYRNAFGMRYGDTFPSKYYLVMTGALAQQGKSAPASLWGMTIPERSATDGAAA